MWERLSRRTMAPYRSLVEPGNRLLAALTVLVLVAGVGFALYGVLS